MASTKSAGTKPDFTKRPYIRIEPDGSNLDHVRWHLEQLAKNNPGKHGLQQFDGGQERLVIPSLEQIAMVPMNLSQLPPRLLDELYLNRQTGCFESGRYIDSHGYARITYEGKTTLLHLVMYRLLVGTPKPGYKVDHLCRVRHCANYLHLEAVTHGENVKRGRDDRLFTNQGQLLQLGAATPTPRASLSGGALSLI